jgi:hypothetical protein
VSGQQPVTIRSGTVWDHAEDGSVIVWLGGSEDETVAAAPIGSAPPLGATVLLLATYDRTYCLGQDVRFGPTPPQVEAPRISKRQGNNIHTDTDQHWFVDTVAQPGGDWMPRSGGVFTGPIWVPEAHQPGQPVRLGEFQAFVGAYMPWAQRISAYSDGQGRVRVDLKGRPTNPYYPQPTRPPEWVIVTPHLPAHGGTGTNQIYVGGPLTAALGGLPAPTKDAVWVGGFQPESWVEFTIMCGWRSAPMYAWDHQPPTGGGGTITTAPAAKTRRTLTTAGGGQLSATYDGSGNKFWDQSKLYFGYYDAQFGIHTSATQLSPADLAQLRTIPAADIAAARLTLTWGHTFSNAGGSVRLRICGDLPATWIAGISNNLCWDIALPAKSGTVTVAMPVVIAQAFATGAGTKGFAIEPAQAGQYGYGYLTPDRITIAVDYYA